jgi:hypothetical protein
MKRLYWLPVVLGAAFFFSAAFESCKSTQAQGASGNAKELITAQRYVFKVQTVLPMGGRTRQLTSDYDLKVSKDTVISYLPYFGRAFTAPMDPSKGGIQFTSTDFEYTVNERSRGGWEILIKPRDVKEVQQMMLTISDNGYGSLQVTSTNRQPISFNGYITERTGRR